MCASDRELLRKPDRAELRGADHSYCQEGGHAEHQAEGVRMPEGMPLDELALRVLIAAETGQLPR
jgi:hypothetical protein